MDEKVLQRPRRFNAVGFCLTGIRIWQWSSSFFAWASFSLLYDHIQSNRLGENSRMKGVQVLGLVSLVYSTLVICCVHIPKTLGLRAWRVSAIISLPGDLTIMGIFLAKITILSYSGLPADCHGLTRDNYDGSDLIRLPADGYNTIRFGSSAVDGSGELDRLCTFPRTVYGLSVVAIFSYTFSLLLSVLYIQQQKRDALDSERIGQQPNSPRPSLRYVGGHVASGMHAPSILDLDLDLDDADSSPPSPARSSRHHPYSRSPSRSTRGARTPSSASSSAQLVSSEGWDAMALASLSAGAGDDTDSVTAGTSLPPRPLPGTTSAPPPRRRWSTSTSSSYNANAFVVTDGFHPDVATGAPVGMDDPPLYSSRPGSLYQESMKYDARLGMPGTPKR